VGVVFGHPSLVLRILEGVAEFLKECRCGSYSRKNSSPSPEIDDSRGRTAAVGLLVVPSFPLQ